MFAGTYYDMPCEAPQSPSHNGGGATVWDQDVNGHQGAPPSDEEEDSDTDSEHIPGTAIEVQDGIRKRKIIRNKNNAQVQQCLHDRSVQSAKLTSRGVQLSQIQIFKKYIFFC